MRIKKIFSIGLMVLCSMITMQVAMAYGDTTTYIGKVYDGDGGDKLEAFFDFPEDIAVDSSGNFYIADTYNNAIRKIATNGIVSTMAGSGAYGDSDGIVSQSKLGLPRGVAVHSNGDLYIADTANNKIKKVSNGTVSTYTSSELSAPEGVAIYGNMLLIVDTGNNALKKIDIASGAGSIETIATGLDSPKKVVTDGTYAYVADSGSYRVMKVNIGAKTKQVLAGSTEGYQEGTGTDAKFNNIWGVALNGNTLYVADGDGYDDYLRAIDVTTGETSLFAEDGSMRTINYPSGLAVYDGGIFVCNLGIGTIERFDIESTWSETYAGSDRFMNQTGSQSAALVGRPNDFVFSPDKSIIYYTENNKIRKINVSDGSVEQVIGHSVDDYREGTDYSDPTMRFSSPSSIEISPDGNTLYVTDRWNNRIRKVDLTGEFPESSLLTGAGLKNTNGSQSNGYQEGDTCATESQGVSGCAYFKNPAGMAISSDGNTLYVTDTGNERVRSVNVATGETTLLAGSGTAGYTNGTGTSASFSKPYGITIDTANTYLYVADTNNHVVRRIKISTGEVTTVAGSGSAGYVDAQGESSYFSYPEYIEYGDDGMIYLTESGGHRVRQVNPSTKITKTVAGSGERGYVDGTRTETEFNNPKGLLVDTVNNKIYVADSWNDIIRTIDITGEAPYSEAEPAVTSVSPGDTYEVAGSTTDTKMLEIGGTGFRYGAVVYMGSHRMNATYVNSETKIAVEVPFGEMSPGSYDIKVVNSDTQSGTLSKGFKITQGGSVPDTHYTNDLVDADSMDVATASQDFWAYSQSLRGGYFVATGDLFGDAKEEIVIGTGTGLGPHVQVFDQGGNLLATFFAYAEHLRSGIRVSVGDVDGNGENEIITAAGPTGRPHVRVFKNDGTLINPGFFALDGEFKGGSYLATGDIDGSGKDEIIIAAGKGGGAHVTVHHDDGSMMANFFAYDTSFRGGIKVATMDYDGDGKQEIVTVPEFGSPHVQLFSVRAGGVHRVNPGFYAFSDTFKGGASIDNIDYDGDGDDEILVGIGEGSPQPVVRIFNTDGDQLVELLAFPKGFGGGVNIAGGDVDGDGKGEVVVIPRSGGGPQLRVINADEL